ncbi:MAG: phasin family protein [Proteobacteria bacterium]|jgi:phasin family protein|nr:phasin family protein [Pseudomonadota bacterium]MBK8961378.1 phasin family protein [Pseudomonadota bacterium]
MENKFIENWQEYGKNAIEAAKELEAINTQVIEKLTGKQMELANAAFEASTKYVSSLGEVKGVQELFSEQTKLATELNEKVLEAARTTADILTETREAYQAWIEKGFKAVSGNADFTIPSFFPLKAAKKAA